MKRFKKVYIEITNVCNLACDFCIQNRRKAAFMEMAQFRRVIDEVKAYTDHVYFHLLGEPLLAPELGGFLHYCGEAGLKVNLTTNGTLVAQRRDILLSSKALRKVSLSLHSYEANLMDIPFETYLSGILDFIRAASVKGIICEMRLWNLDSTQLKGKNAENDRILDFITDALGLPDIEGMNGAGRGKSGLKLKENVYLGFQEKFQWPEIQVLGGAAPPQAFCLGLRDQIGILVDGTVVPCCLDSQGTISLGNIHESPLGAILASRRATGIYDGFTARKPVEGLCRSCSYAERFTG
jgi:MoaA/NifB/PqqE/SkfB family radical SAM enzyme